EELKMIPENVFTIKTYNDKTITNLENMAEVKAESYEILIDEDEFAHIPRTTNLDDFKNDLILDFVDEEEFEEYENYQEDEVVNLDIGETLITHIDFSEEIQWKESLADPDNILDADEALKIMKQGTLEEEVYKVQQGDVLGSIAEKHDLSVEE